MKQIAYFFTILFTLLLSACLNSNYRSFVGPEHHGKNKLVKKEKSDQETEMNSVILDINESELSLNHSDFTNSQNIFDSIRISDKSIPVTLNFNDTVKLSEQIDNIKNEIKNSRNIITHKPSKNQRILDDDEERSPGKKILIAFLIFLGILVVVALLIILIAYLFVKVVEEALGCYIATMTYGSYDHPKVKTLRTFRDEFLAKRKWGLKFISFYYRYSPGFVQKLQNKPLINSIIRANLNAFVFVLRTFSKQKNRPE